MFASLRSGLFSSARILVTHKRILVYILKLLRRQLQPRSFSLAFEYYGTLANSFVQRCVERPDFGSIRLLC